jgi:hypothetical protein
MGRKSQAEEPVPLAPGRARGVDAVTLTESDLAWAVSSGFLSEEQASALWQALVGRSRSSVYRTPAIADSALPPHRPFGLLTVAYYFGAVIVMVAMGLFATLGWQTLGGAGCSASLSCTQSPLPPRDVGFGRRERFEPPEAFSSRWRSR